VKNSCLIVGDLGGGTADLTGYIVKSTKPLRLAESSAAQCCLAGGEFVNQAFKKYLEEYLSGSEWARPEILKEAVSHFDNHAKRTFVDLNMTSTIKLGTSPDSDASRNISRSRLKISGYIAKLRTCLSRCTEYDVFVTAKRWHHSLPHLSN